MTDQNPEYLSPIRKRLESLRSAMDQDIPSLEAAVLDLTSRQVMEMSTGLDSALEAYKGAMQPYYRVTRKGRPSGGQGSSYYQRKKEREENVAKLAQEAVDKQGYVIAASIVTQTGYREQSVAKTLEELASGRGWEKKRDRETKSYRYTPKLASETPASS